MAENMYEGLRALALEHKPETVGLDDTVDPALVYGIVADLGMANGTATVVSLWDGSASMYYSSGGGMLGGGAHGAVAAATRRLIADTQSRLELFTENGVGTLPTRDHATFTVLTRGQKLHFTAAIQDLQSGRAPGGELFNTLNRVIYEMSLLKA